MNVLQDMKYISMRALFLRYLPLSWPVWQSRAAVKSSLNLTQNTTSVDIHIAKHRYVKSNELIVLFTVNNYRQVTGMVTGENFAFFIYRHFVEIL